MHKLTSVAVQQAKKELNDEGHLKSAYRGKKNEKNYIAVDGRQHTQL